MSVFWASAALGKPTLQTMQWGGLKFPNSLSDNDEHNAGYDVTFRIDVDFNKQIGKARLVPFLTLYTQGDSAGYTYNSKQQIGIGVALKYPLYMHSNFDVSAMYKTDYRPLTGVFNKGFLVSLNYNHYRSWDISEHKQKIFSVWASAKFPSGVTQQDKGNILAQGQAKWMWKTRLGQSKYHWGKFAVLGAHWDKNQHEYNNKLQLDLGGMLSRNIRKSDVKFWIKYRFEHRYNSSESLAGPMVGISFFKKEKGKGIRKRTDKSWLKKVLKRRLLKSVQ